MNPISMFLDTAASSGDTTGTSSGSIWSMLISFGLIILVFYFFMIRPQRKQEKKDSQMRDSLQVGDEVTTIGGIIGRVVSIKDETFTLETSRDRTKMRFLRSAIKSVDVRAADLRAAAEAPATTEESAPAVEAPAEKKSRKEKKAEKEAEKETK